MLLLSCIDVRESFDLIDIKYRDKLNNFLNMDKNYEEHLDRNLGLKYKKGNSIPLHISPNCGKLKRLTFLPRFVNVPMYGYIFLTLQDLAYKNGVLHK